MTVFDRSLEFSVHEDTNRIIVRVINRLPEGDEVIREIPPERILDLVAALMNIVGLLVDQRIEGVVHMSTHAFRLTNRYRCRRRLKVN